MLKLEAMRILSEDPVRFADLIDPIHRGSADILVADERGVLIDDHGAGAYMMTATSPAAAEAFLDLMDDPRYAVVHQDFLIPLIQEKFYLNHHTECGQAVFLGDAMPPISRPDLRIETLDASWAEPVADQYAHGRWVEHIRMRLEAGVMIGAFRESTLVGFIGQHEEGSMGMLEIYPEYRRQGIAAYLVTTLANRIIAEGRRPFDQIITGNTASENLQRKLGFTLTDKKLWWMSTRAEDQLASEKTPDVNDAPSNPPMTSGKKRTNS